MHGKLMPYLISAYNGSEYITSYAQVINGVIDQKLLFNSFINQLVTLFPKKGKSLIVYAHNLSGFDGIFLLNHLLPFGKVEPIIFNSKLIAIKVRLINGKTITFKDSYLLLPASIRRLCITFKIEASKGLFPFSLRNIFYKGLFPAYKYWTGISLEQYLDMKSEFNLLGIKWSFKDEAIKYCQLDCKCLFDILIKYNDLIYQHFNINIHSVLTLPALAMKIYKSKFMPENTIYQLTPNIDRDIRQAYTGGAVDVYIPHNRLDNFFSWIFETLYYYDVNSLYPFIMANTPMPVGKPKYFKGDIRVINPEAYGYFYCEITSPSDIAHPILQQRIKTTEGIRTIAGIGSWTGWVYSEEMYNAQNNHNYQFNILMGYEFDKGYIFKDYIDTLYELRMQYEKDDPMNYVAKLLMNSLYGKFGMKPQSTKVDIYNLASDSELNSFFEMVDKYGPSIQDWFKLDQHYVVIRDKVSDLYNNEDNDHYHGLDVNVAISAAITAGGRMWMSTIKNRFEFNLFYSDTDSFVTNKPLPSFMVGNKLGQFKLEYTIERAVFLAPKVYAFITSSGEEIIKVKGIKQDALSGLHIEDLENLKTQLENLHKINGLKKSLMGVSLLKILHIH
jgi:hypothetical protein